jgi:hypothetical protein
VAEHYVDRVTGEHMGTDGVFQRGEAGRRDGG